MKQNIMLPVSKRLVVPLLTFGILGCHNNQKSSIDYEAIFMEHYNDRVNLFIEENKTAKDVDVVFLHHLKDDFSDFDNQFVKSLIELDSINTINYCAVAPMLGQQPNVG